MKKIMNAPENIVHEMCAGLVMAHPELELLQKPKVIRRKKMNPDKVSLISGGGSGHEPAHAGFVGTGMLDAAVCGDIFASPSQIQVYEAIKAAASKKGTLLIIKNYSGDMMNFKNAAYLAQEDGIRVEYVRVDDDIAVQDSLYTVGRRGVAGTIFVHKIAGAAAEAGKSLQEVKAVAEKVAKNVRSIGFALTSCTVPAKGTPTFELQETEMEYGVGIHGEPGVKKETLADADTLAARMIEAVSKDLGLKGSEQVAVLINGFGATPLMELYLFNSAVRRELDLSGITVVRTLVGNYMTSIDMAGASVSVLRLDDELLGWLNQPCATPALTIAETSEPSMYIAPLKADADNAGAASGEVCTPAAFSSVGEAFSLNNMIYAVDVMCETIIKNEVPFCELDAHAGDGDFGMSVAKGFKQLKREWKPIVEQPGLTIGKFLNSCSLIIMEHCGGASGPIWGSAFRAASRQTGDTNALSVGEFAEMLLAGVKGIQLTGERSFGRGAGVGDKTLMDALIPCADVWHTLSAKPGASFKEAFEAGKSAAVEGAKKTETFAARMGRAGTVGERSIGYPDAGAYALGVIFTEICNRLNFD